MASNNGKILAGAALLAFLLFGNGRANASEPPLPGTDPDPPKPDDPKPPEDKPPPVNEPPPDPPGDDFGGNWGNTPPGLIPSFMLAEQASGIKGLARFLGVKAWQAARAGQPLLGPAEAAAWASSNANLAQNAQNKSASEIAASFRALERVTLKKGVVGPNGGVGAYDKPWAKPAYYSEIGNAGSLGLFDMLAGPNVYAGIHDSNFTPLLAYHADVMFRVDVQLYMAGYFAYRCFNSPKYPLFSRANGDPVKLWSGLAACWATPDGFAQKPDGSQAAKDAAQRFKERAQEVGIDLSKVAYPGYMKQVWPGAKNYYKALGVAP